MMHYPNFFNFNPFSSFGFSGYFWPLILIWSLFWNGWALWDAARNGSRVWFIVLLIVETAGILEIAYLFFLSPNAKVNLQRIKQIFSR